MEYLRDIEKLIKQVQKEIEQKDIRIRKLETELALMNTKFTKAKNMFGGEK